MYEPNDRDGGREIDTALDLMRSALTLLDAAEERMPALHLQHAISLAEGEPVWTADSNRDPKLH